jgi:hypothetical protein
MRAYIEPDCATLSPPEDRTPPPLLLVDTDGGRLILPFPRRRGSGITLAERQTLATAVARVNAMPWPTAPAVLWLTADGPVSAGRIADTWLQRMLNDRATVALRPPAA